MSVTVGRNDPCPCGSGKKYKKCCLDKDRATGAAADSSSLQGSSGAANELRMMMEGQQFESDEEMNAFLAQVNQNRNQRGVGDFLGLSPEHMHRFLHFPFESSQFVVFPDVLDSEPDAPLMTLFTLMADAIGDSGVKATVKGNLPRALCREVYEVFKSTGYYHDARRPRSINSEDDFGSLHEVRIVAELAGLIELTKNRYTLTGKYRKIHSTHGKAGVYPCLFRAYCQQYNWGYLDSNAEASIVQMSFTFTLYMLERQQQNTVIDNVLADAFLTAFPMLTEEFESLGDGHDEYSQARFCYKQRALCGFCRMTGIAAVTPTTDNFINREFTVTPLPLFKEVVQFQGGLRQA